MASPENVTDEDIEEVSSERGHSHSSPSCLIHDEAFQLASRSFVREHAYIKGEQERRVGFEYCKAYSRLVEFQQVDIDVWRVCFVYRRGSSKPGVVWRVCFDYCKTCMRPVDAQRVGFEYCKTCSRPVQVRRFRFVCHTACVRPVEFRRVCFCPPQCM